MANLPNANQFVGSMVTESQFKLAFTSLLNFLNELSGGFEASKGGVYGYATVSLFEADKMNVPKNSSVRIATGSEAGLYTWNGAVLTKVQDFTLTDAKTYTDLQLSKFLTVNTTNPACLYEICDNNGNVLLSIDLNGRLDFDASIILSEYTKFTELSAYLKRNDAEYLAVVALLKSFSVNTSNPARLLEISDVKGNVLFSIDNYGRADFDASLILNEYAKTSAFNEYVRKDNTDYLKLLDLFKNISINTANPARLFEICDNKGNVLFSIDNTGRIFGDFAVWETAVKDALSDVFTTKVIPRDDTHQIVDKNGNVLARVDRNGAWWFPEVNADSLTAIKLNSKLSSETGLTVPSVPNSRLVTLPPLNYMRLNLAMKAMPTDLTGEISTSGTCTFSDATTSVIYLQANVELSIQGQGSAFDKKKNFTLDVLNSEGKSLAIKFGDMIAADSFHLKGFYRDPSHFRDQGGYRFWKSMIETLDYPYCKVNNDTYLANIARVEDAEFTADAKYYPHGFPVEIYMGDAFYGLYTLRLKKTRQNYAMNNADLKHIFLDSATYSAYLKEPFDPTDWEIKSPKMKNYVDQGPIPPAFENNVLASINRLFDFTSNLSTNFANHADVINLPHWLVFYINCELIGDWDHNGNNYNIMTWDNTHWTIIPYDLDWTLNWYKGNGAVQSGFILGGGDIWLTFRTVYKNELKQMWTKLRNSNVITTEKLVKQYRDVAKFIPRAVYTADKNRWGVSPYFSETDYPTLEQAYAYINARIAYLDSQWLITS